MAYKKKIINLLGVAAGGLLRLLLTKNAYETCKGGVTELTSYAALNMSTTAGLVYHPADSVRIWQVCIIKRKKNRASSID